MLPLVSQYNITFAIFFVLHTYSFALHYERKCRMLEVQFLDNAEYIFIAILNFTLVCVLCHIIKESDRTKLQSIFEKKLY